MSSSSPLGHRPTRSTPVAGVSPDEITPVDIGAVASPGQSSGSAEPQEPSRPRESDSDTAVPPRHLSSREGIRSRPGSRMAANRVSLKGNEPWDAYEPEGPMHRSASSRSHRPPRFRDDFDYDFGADPRDYPSLRDYERHWRGGYGPDRYTSRRSTRPPPAIFNHRRYAAMGNESDEERYGYDDLPVARDPFESPRMRRVPDEELGFQSDGSRQRHKKQDQPWGADVSQQLDWNNMTAKEKAKVMRLPLTEWMNSTVKNHFVAFLGELVGTTMFLVFAFAGTEVANIRSQASDSNTTTGEATGFNVATLLYISLSFGFSLMVNVWIFFRISGGLFNPAVTVAMVLVRAISIVRAMILFIAQMAGSMLASVIVRYLFPESFNVRTTLGGGASIVQGVFIEALLTAELVFTIFMLAKEKHRATFIAPVGIGLALFISELVGVQFTGGSLNPARSFGPCVITLTFDKEHWIYCKLQLLDFLALSWATFSTF